MSGKVCGLMSAVETARFLAIAITIKTKIWPEKISINWALSTSARLFARQAGCATYHFP